MYAWIKTHKENNPVRIIRSGYGTVIEHSSNFIEKYLYGEVNKIDSMLKDTHDMSNVIDITDHSDILNKDSFLVSFDIVNIFPSISNIFGLEAVSEILGNWEIDFPPAECTLETLKLCVECNNSLFNEKFHLQEDDTTMRPHMSCSYSDITICRFDLKALNYPLKIFCWKRFRDDIFAVRNHSLQNKIYNYSLLWIYE